MFRSFQFITVLLTIFCWYFLLRSVCHFSRCYSFVSIATSGTSLHVQQEAGD